MSMTNEEKPWLLYFSPKSEALQIDQEEYNALMGDIEGEKSGATLKDGSFVNLRIASIVANPHYVSQESIDKTRKKWTHWYEYQQLKKNGTVKDVAEYKLWKKESNKNMKRFEKSVNE